MKFGNGRLETVKDLITRLFPLLLENPSFDYPRESVSLCPEGFRKTSPYSDGSCNFLPSLVSILGYIVFIRRVSSGWNDGDTVLVNPRSHDTTWLDELGSLVTCDLFDPVPGLVLYPRTDIDQVVARRLALCHRHSEHAS